MNKKIFNGLASLILPLGAYANIAPAGSYQPGQRSYLRSGLSHGATLDTKRFAVSADKLPINAEEDNELIVGEGQPVRELIVIDTAVPDKHIFYREAKPGVDIVEIDSSRPGLSQLVEALEGYKNLSALHIVSHAEDGVLLLGNSRITAENIKHEIEAFAALNGALRNGGDLLLYGCDLATGDAGTELLDIVQKNTHLDLAASSNLTGASINGGDWNLEIQRGEIESGLPFSAKATADFSHVLTGTYTLQNFGYILGGAAANTGCPTDRSGYTYGYYSLISGNYTVCGFMGIGSGDSGNGFGGTTVNMSHYFGTEYTPAFLGESGTAASNSGTHAIEVKSSTPFQLTNVVADEWPPNPAGSNGYTFSNVRIIGYIDGGGTIASSAHSTVDDHATTSTFTFDSDELADFAGVSLTKFRLEFQNDTGHATGMRLVTYTTAEPVDADGNLTAAAGVTEPVGLATTVDTVGEAVDVFDFTLSDGGTSDGVPMTVSQVVVNVSGSSTDTERSQVTWRLDGPDVSNMTGTYNTGTDTITFSGLSVSIANGGNETYTINAHYNDTLGLTEDHTFILSVDGDTDLTVGGTQMGATSAVNNGTGSTVDVVATRLSFTTEPTGSVSGAALTTQPVVTAQDDAFNTDVDFTETITLTEASAGTLTNNTQAATAGVATFTNLTYTATADQQNFILTANDQDGVGSDLSTVSSDPVTSDVVATKLLFSTQPSPTTVNSGLSTSFTTVPVVSVADANDIVDTGYSTDITLAEVNGAGTATMSATGDTDGNGSTVSITPTSGVATFTGMQITYTASGGGSETFNLRALSGGLTTADSNQFSAHTVPTVNSVSVPANGTYVTGQNLDFTVNTSQNVTVNTTGGTPQIALTVGATARYATYLSGSGTSALAFRYTVQAGDNDTDGIAVAAAIDANSGTLRDGIGNDMVTTLNSVGSTASVLVDAVAPTVSSVSVPANATYIAGQNLDFTVNTDENVTVSTIGGTPHIVLTIGATTRYATYLSGSGTSALVYRYTVQVGDNDTDGIAVGALETNSGTLRDGAGNDLNSTLNSVGSTASVLVDAVTPTVSSVSVPSNGTYITGQNLDFTVNTNENVTVDLGSGHPSIALTIGATTRYADYLSGSGTSALLFRYTVQAGDEDSDGIAVAASIDPNSGTLRDGAGNDLNSALNSVGATTAVLVDALAPSGHSISFDDGTINVTEATGISFTFAGAEVGADYSYTISSSGGGTPVTAGGTLASATDQISGIDISGLNDGTLTLSVTLMDSGGNDAGAVTDTATLDATPPTATVVVADSELLTGETSLVTITFLEPVTGFSNSGLTIASGSLDTVSSGDGGTTWTATFTPDADIYTEDNVITLDNTSVTDAAGNTGSGSTDSNNYTVRTQALTLLVTSNLDTGDDEITAASLADDESDGNGLSLREALFWARGGDAISFDLDSGTAGNQGGGITLNGNQLVVAASDLVIDGDLDDDGAADVTLSGNNASRVMLINTDLSGVELTGLTLTQGLTGGGGGALQLGSGASVTISDSGITNSSDGGVGGGGVYGVGATLTMIDSTVSGNTSATFGGGLRIVGAGATLNLINSTVSGNTTTDVGAHGGGIQYGGTGTLTIVNSTISGNSASGASTDGGGLRITTGTSYVYNTTIVGNSATNNSGGVSANGTSDTFVNTVVAGNTAGAGATAAVGGSPLATGGSANDVGGTIETATNSYFGSSVTITTDIGSFNNQGTASLLLDDLANYNGSPIQTHRPQTGSALLEAGSNAALPLDTFDLDGDSDTAEALPVDANGDRRVSNIVDIGAVEGNAVPELSNVNGGGTYVENGSAVVIDNDILVSDTDLDLLNGGNGDYGGASAVFVRNGGVVVSDIFGFNAGSGISLSDDNLVRNGQIIASFDTSTAGQLTITFTNANGEIPTQTDVSAILQQVAYSSSSEDPGSSVGIDFTLHDGAGASVTETATLTITEINDAPTISGTPPTSVVAGTNYLFVPVLNDPEGDAVTVTASNLPAWANLDGATGTVSGTPGNADTGNTSNIVLTVSDGTDSASLSGFAIAVVFDGSLDSDSDGIPDGVELLNSLDPYNPADADLDMDGDGVSNVDEYLADSDILTDDYGPVFPPLDTLGANATGLLTQRPELTAPIAVDGLDGPITATLTESSELLAPGVHALTWFAVDAAGNRTEATQQLDVYPLISLGRDQVRAEGSTATIRVLLNGQSPVYPLTVGFTVAGTASAGDHDLAVTSVTFSQDEVERQVPVNLIDDSVPEGTETLLISLDESGTTAGSANFGSKRLHEIRIVEENVAPLLRLNLQQSSEERRIITRDGGSVLVTAAVDDPNPGDSHLYDWQFPMGVTVTPLTDASATFDPSMLEPGIYEIALVVTEDNMAPLMTGETLIFQVLETAPALGTGDSDGDGIDDATEGLADTDGDGQPDYLDSIDLPNVLHESSGDGGRFLVEGDPGLRLELGQWSLLDGADGAQVSGQTLTAGGIPGDSVRNVGGYFDFIVRGIPEPGASINVVLPQRQPIPANPVYRKFAGTWFSFVVNADNQLTSAAGMEGVCPPPGSADYSAGLNPGHWCVQLTIADGGPNDADGEANGTVVDPGGVGSNASPVVHKTRGGGGGGGALSPQLLAVFLLLSLARRQRVRQTAVGLLALLLAVAGNANAGNTSAQTADEKPWWRSLYLQGGVAYAHTSFSRSDAERRLDSADTEVDVLSVDNSRTAWNLGFGYSLSDRWALELSYLDLGEVEMTVAVPITAEQIAHVHPESGDGWSLSGVYRHPLSQRLSLQARVGLFDWEQEYKTTRAGERVDSFSDTGTDLLLGFGLDYRCGDNMAITGEVQGVDFDREPTLLIGVGLRLWFN